MNKFLYYPSLLMLSVMFFLVIYQNVTPFIPAKPITVNTQPFVVENKVLKPGDPIRFISDACRHGSYQVVIFPVLKGEAIYNMTPQFFITMEGCSQLINASIFIPLVAKPGTYYLEINNLIKVSSTKEVLLTTRTEEFTVIP